MKSNDIYDQRLLLSGSLLTGWRLICTRILKSIYTLDTCTFTTLNTLAHYSFPTSSSLLDFSYEDFKQTRQ